MEGQRREDANSLAIAEPSSVLMGRTVSPPSSPRAHTGPTLEQNMAFAALQQGATTSPNVGSGLRPEKRPLVDQTHVDDPRAVKRKLEE